jgi:hypothetical protein
MTLLIIKMGVLLKFKMGVLFKFLKFKMGVLFKFLREGRAYPRDVHDSVETNQKIVQTRLQFELTQ